MSEKSIIIYESTTGKRMALRDAVELDDSGNARIIERVDLSSGKSPTPIGFPKRGGVYTKAYTNGNSNSHTLIAGDVLIGSTSNATCRVISFTTTSGVWASGTAAGVLTIVDKSGTFIAENLNVGVGVYICTIAAGDMSSSTLTATDTFDLTALTTASAELVQNLITVGDKSSLVVTVEQTVSGGTATITPIIYDNSTVPNIISILPSKLFTQPYSFRRGASSGTYVLPAQIWDCFGAYKIGLHLSAITGTSNSVQIWGYVI